MYIEDIISTFALRIKLNPFDSTLILSFFDQLAKGNGLTEKQSIIAVKILRRYVQQILPLSGKDITPWLDNPTYKFGIRTLTVVKNISIAKNDKGAKLVKVKFPYDEALLNEIKKNRTSFTSAEWNVDEKSWIFLLEDSVVAFLSSWITTKGFTADEEFKSLADQLPAIIDNVENFVPMVVISEEKHKFVNVHPSVPQPTSTDIVKTMFEARLAGIEHWENDLSEKFDQFNLSEFVKKYIRSGPREGFSINLEENSIMDLIPIVKNMSPCIITVPGGNELAKLQQSLPMLKAAGFENSEISVLFRLPNDTGQDFNNFVKEEKLNSPITQNTRVVFLSGKVPKPLFESGLRFNCVINFNFYNVHYTLANLIKNLHNVINVIADKKQKSPQHEYM